MATRFKQGKTIPDLSLAHDVTFEDDGALRLHKAWRIGPGKVIPSSVLDDMYGDEVQGATGARFRLGMQSAERALNTN
eukprot:SAG31_NODE_38362_length_296_cov_2.284264_1_plen_77_part_01